MNQTEELLNEEKDIMQQIKLRNQMHLTKSKEYINAFETNKWNHLPEITILGKKKCGTKALLTFLLEHPKIRGGRAEFHWHAVTGLFNKIVSKMRDCPT